MQNASNRMATKVDLFTQVQVGPHKLPNRLVMAPLTRNRAGADNAPHALNATYYAQRASAGLIVSEATQISPQGVGYPGTPGIHSRKQIEGWKLVTQAVHAKGGRIFLQLWHVGRISHPSLQPNGALPVAPSAIKPAGNAFTISGPQPFVTPRALEPDEIANVVAQYRKAAANALTAGFDGVEIHAANGYLLDQFLRDGTNHRIDRYGGSLENRARLLLEVTDAVTGVWGANRVGVRISPVSKFNDMSDSDAQRTFEYVAQLLNGFGLAYLHVVEMDADGKNFDFANLRAVFNGIYIANTGYTKQRGDGSLAKGEADLIAFGTLFLANPDLPARFAMNASLNQPDPATFYGGDAKGYTDYPSLQMEPA